MMEGFLGLFGLLLFITLFIFLFWGDPDVMDAAIEWTLQTLTNSAR